MAKQAIHFFAKKTRHNFILNLLSLYKKLILVKFAILVHCASLFTLCANDLNADAKFSP